MTVVNTFVGGNEGKKEKIFVRFFHRIHQEDYGEHIHHRERKRERERGGSVKEHVTPIRVLSPRGTWTRERGKRVARVGKGAARYGAARSGVEKFPGGGNVARGSAAVREREERTLVCAHPHP